MVCTSTSMYLNWCSSKHNPSPRGQSHYQLNVEEVNDIHISASSWYQQFQLATATLDIPHYFTVCIVGASLSEPHMKGTAFLALYIYIYVV